MILLKQSTAATVRVGPFVDATDAVTPETGITLGAADQAELLKHSGATVDISAATWAAITGCDGYYDLSLTTSHTDTLGMLTVVVQDASVCIPVPPVRAMVLPAAIYDSLIGGTDTLPVDVTQWNGTNVATPTVAGVPEVDITHLLGTAWLSPATAGTPDVNVRYISGDSAAADALETAYDDTAGPVPAAGIVDQGTAQSATSTTLQLRSGAAFADDELIGSVIVITGGSTGVGQSRIITDYVSSTDTATVDTWTTTPSGTITYKVWASPPSDGAIDQILAIAEKVNDTLEDDSGVWRFTANALEQAPSGTGASAASIAAALFTVDTGETEASAVAGSVVYEIVQNAGGGGGLDAAGVRAALGMASADLDTQLDAIKADTAATLIDTNELQGDWANGGRLDLILDARASQTSVDDLPTNAELATALGTADDAVLSAVAVVDANVDAIKAKTDSLTFTVAGVVDANVQRINDVTITGDGQIGTEFGV